MFECFWKYAFLFLFFLQFGTYILQHIVVAFFFKTQHLKRKYNAEWALVTGGSSGELVVDLLGVPSCRPTGMGCTGLKLNSCMSNDVFLDCL